MVCGCVLHSGAESGGVVCFGDCVSMLLGWDFYWFGAGRGCDMFLWGGRVWKGSSWGRVDI